MPPTSPSTTPTPMGIVNTSSGGGGSKKGIIIAVVAIVIIALGIVAGLILVRQNQNVNEQAAVTDYVIPTFTPIETPTESPIPTDSASLTASPTAQPTETPTASATPRLTTTPFPVPVTGFEWPTYVAFVVGLVVIIASVLIAL